MTRRHLLPSSFWRTPASWGGERENPFHSLHREIDRLFDDFNRGLRWPEWADKLEAWAPSVDVGETDRDLQITAELPGVDEKDVEITLPDNVLIIKGEKKAETEEKEKDCQVLERSYGAFERRIPMPYQIDPDAVDAKFTRGVLTVILPKPPEEKKATKRISVKAG